MSTLDRKLKTRSEKREEIARKKKIKEQKGGTLAGQMQRTKTLRSFKGSAKKMIKK